MELLMSTAANESSAVHVTIENLVDDLRHKLSRLPAGQRYMVGIVGVPGAGKSTVTKWLVDGINAVLDGNPAIAVPMDGYHLSNETLEQMGLLHLKGIPATFDAAGFIELLRRLRTTTDANVYCPLFDRSIEASILDAIVIEPRHQLCVVEGNNLLLEDPPWDQCLRFFDEVWFLDVDLAVIKPRLQKRHERNGTVTPEAAQAKMESTDLPNARLILASKSRATRIIHMLDQPLSPASGK
jgi:pantothenate kinase